MGDTLSKPITEKHSERKESDTMKVGASGMQGWRRGMEDAHTTEMALGGRADRSFFAVYDGHCGKQTAEFCGRTVHNLLMAHPGYDNGEYHQALKGAFLQSDEELKNDPAAKEGSGCTAVSLLMTEDKLLCANAGDSRCVLYSGGKVVPLSFDHKPVNDEEFKRIRNAGGFVSSGRVNGNLALSRAIGDVVFKKNENLPAEEQAVTANPEIIERARCPEDEFVVLACDGIWDMMSNEAVCAAVSQELQSGNMDLARICEGIFDKCLAPSAPGLGCDNMTMIIVLFKDHWRNKEKSPA